MKSLINTINKNRYAMIALAIFAIVAVAMPTSALAWGGGFMTPTASYSGYSGYSGYSYPTYQNSYPVYYPQTTPVYYPVTQPYYQSLTVSCYPSSNTTTVNNAVTWSATASGGSGAYTYNWSGTDGLNGYGSIISRAYGYAGIKWASVTVASGGQTATQACNGQVQVNDNYSYNYNQYYNNNQYYNYPYQNYAPLSASCSANTLSAPAGGYVYWNASASGGNGAYQYSWSGTDGLYTNGPTAVTSYNSNGTKTAQVTVTSGYQTITQTCNNTVAVGGAYLGQTYAYAAPTTYQSTNQGLDVACYADPVTSVSNQPVTWSAEVTGGAAPYTYSWTGSDGLTGSQSSVTKYYSASGSKSAVVSVTSADGKSATHACSNSLAVRSPAARTVAVAVAKPATQPVAIASPAPTVTVTPTQVPNTQLSAASLFSLSNVPWGWVAILVILVLFATVMYLLFNRQKI